MTTALVSVCSTAEAVRPQHEPFLGLGRDAGCAPRAWHTPGALPAPPRLRTEGMSGEKESHTGLPARARAYRRERRACPEGCTSGRLGCACRLHGSWLRHLGMLRTLCPRRQSWTCRRDPGAEWGHRSGLTQRRAVEAAQRDAGHLVGQATFTPGASPRRECLPRSPSQWLPPATGRKAFLQGQGCRQR